MPLVNVVHHNCEYFQKQTILSGLIIFVCVYCDCVHVSAFTYNSILIFVVYALCSNCYTCVFICCISIKFTLSLPVIKYAT